MGLFDSFDNISDLADPIAAKVKSLSDAAFTTINENVTRANERLASIPGDVKGRCDGAFTTLGNYGSQANQKLDKLADLPDQVLRKGPDEVKRLCDGAFTTLGNYGSQANQKLDNLAELPGQVAALPSELSNLVRQEVNQAVQAIGTQANKIPDVHSYLTDVIGGYMRRLPNITDKVNEIPNFHSYLTDTIGGYMRRLPNITDRVNEIPDVLNRVKELPDQVADRMLDHGIDSSKLPFNPADPAAVNAFVENIGKRVDITRVLTALSSLKPSTTRFTVAAFSELTAELKKSIDTLKSIVGLEKIPVAADILNISLRPMEVGIDAAEKLGNVIEEVIGDLPFPFDFSLMTTTLKGVNAQLAQSVINITTFKIDKWDAAMAGAIPVFEAADRAMGVLAAVFPGTLSFAVDAGAAAGVLASVGAKLNGFKLGEAIFGVLGEVCGLTGTALTISDNYLQLKYAEPQEDDLVKKIADAVIARLEPA